MRLQYAHGSTVHVLFYRRPGVRLGSGTRMRTATGRGGALGDIYLGRGLAGWIASRRPVFSLTRDLPYVYGSTCACALERLPNEPTLCRPRFLERALMCQNESCLGQTYDSLFGHARAETDLVQ